MIAPPTSPTRVGVVGAGQLALMMAEAAPSAGVELTVLATSADDAACARADHVLFGASDDLNALNALSEVVDVVTFDHELVDLDQLVALEARGVILRPGPEALLYAVDKAEQRLAFYDAGLAVPRFLVVDDDTSRDELLRFLDSLDNGAVVKAARGGYDGRGVVFPRDQRDAVDAVEDCLRGGRVVVEERLTLVGEVAQVLACDVAGQVSAYPLVTTVQRDGMCVEVTYPCELAPALHERASAIARDVASLINPVGIVAIELFVTKEGLVINEIALRPHNTGHWTIEGTSSSQFRQHLLAVSGQPLGDASPVVASAVMVNVVGAATPATPGAVTTPDVAVHDYGKAWRPGRKLGHVTAIGDSVTDAHVRAWQGARSYGTGTKESS